jgi:hypothetical protein
MFINEPLTHRTIDRSRDAILEKACVAPEQTTVFLLTWQGRKIPFLAQHTAAKNPATGRSVVDWHVFDVGKPLTLGTLNLPGLIFTNAAEKASVAGLIREALSVYVFACGQGPNDPGSIEIDLT